MAPTKNVQPPAKPLAKQSGQATTEYVLVLSVIGLAWFTPWMGAYSPFGLMMEAFDIYLQSFHNVLSLPIP